MKNLILDTDILNEMDDQFAIAYLIWYLKQYKNEYSLEAITVAPFDPSKYLKTNDKKQAMILAKKEIEKIFNLTNFKCPIYLGSDKYLNETADRNFEAVDKIIEIVKSSNNKVTILGIACATNIAMTIQKCPEIADKLEIVWLGGNSLAFPDNNEFNLLQDSKAVNIILNSKAKLTIIPARSVSSALFLSKEVSEKFILPNGSIGKYLHNLIVDFAKNRKGAGRRVWDIACIYELFNHDYAMEKLKIESFRSPIVYWVRIGVK